MVIRGRFFMQMSVAIHGRVGLIDVHFAHVTNGNFPVCTGDSYTHSNEFDTRGSWFTSERGVHDSWLVLLDSRHDNRQAFYVDLLGVVVARQFLRKTLFETYTFSAMFYLLCYTPE